VTYCKTPIIFGAGVELRLSFDAANVLLCKKPRIFGACVELRLQLSMWMCCIVKHL